MRISKNVCIVASGDSGLSLTGPGDCTVYLVDGGSSCALIDAGFTLEPEQIVRNIEDNGIDPDRVDSILLTHGHFDHLGALDDALARWPGLPVAMRAEDAKWAFDHPANQYPPLYCHQRRPESLVEAGETWACGGIAARLIPTPGHTPGGQCILLTQDVPAPLCFTGDTLFQGSVGRTDLPGGSFPALDRSVRALAANLAPETTILPGHGPASTIARERRFNPYLQDDPGF